MTDLHFMALQKKTNHTIAEAFIKLVAKLRTYMFLERKQDKLLVKFLYQMTLLNITYHKLQTVLKRNSHCLSLLADSFLCTYMKAQMWVV